MITIRAETEADHAAVRRLNEAAFESAAEADLVEALRREASPYISLVAELDKEIVGHIFFSPVSIESAEESFNALGLAPMAVLPEYQNRGIGSQLVRQGLNECLRLGHDVVVVLGHAQYYPRFGFVPASRRKISSEYQVPEEVFMVAELKTGALDGKQGLVKYHPAFGKV